MMTNSLPKKVTKIRDLIDSPEKWTQHAWARDEYGGPVQYDTMAAKCWCLAAGLHLIYHVDDQDDVRAKLMNAANHLRLYSDSLTNLNDAPGRTFDDICRILELADV